MWLCSFTFAVLDFFPTKLWLRLTYLQRLSLFDNYTEIRSDDVRLYRYVHSSSLKYLLVEWYCYLLSCFFLPWPMALYWTISVTVSPHEVVLIITIVVALTSSFLLLCRFCNQKHLLPKVISWGNNSLFPISLTIQEFKTWMKRGWSGEKIVPKPPLTTTLQQAPQQINWYNKDSAAVDYTIIGS